MAKATPTQIAYKRSLEKYPLDVVAKRLKYHVDNFIPTDFKRIPSIAELKKDIEARTSIKMLPPKKECSVSKINVDEYFKEFRERKTK